MGADVLPPADDGLLRTLFDFDAERAGMVEAGSFRLAVVGSSGEARWVSSDFLELVGDPAASSDCARLIAQAAVSGRASGVVATLSRGAVVVEARTGGPTGEWPLSPAARVALDGGRDGTLLVAYAPSRAPGAALSAADVLGLAPREADLAAALLEAPNLKAAADRVGMSVDTAKDALARACRKAGVRGASDLVGRLLDLSCAGEEPDAETIGATLGLSRVEARVAVATAGGLSIEATAASLGTTTETVRTYRKAIFAKTGARRDRDLRRLVTEASHLGALTAASEIVEDARAVGERLRVIRRTDGRRVALIDYGPASNRALFVMHGFTTGRRLPHRFVRRLQSDGWRPLVVQRPGFGLTDPAPDHFADTGADDMFAVLQVLDAPDVALLARDGGAPTAIAFAERHPEVFGRGVILNPRSTRDRPPGGASFVSELSKLLLARPAVISFVAEATRQRTGSRNMGALLTRIGSGVEGDRIAAEQPEITTHLVRDAQALLARTSKGLADELRIYAEGWQVPKVLPGGSWRAAWGQAMWSAEKADGWEAAGADTRVIEGLGLLPAYTHPDALADLLKP